MNFKKFLRLYKDTELIFEMRTKMETGEPETMDDLEEHTHGPHIYVTEDGRKVSISTYKED